MRIMTFNIQHALDYQRQIIDFEPFAALIRQHRVDICGLNEVRGDGEHAKGYTDQTNTLGDLLEMARFFGEATRVEGDNPYGNAILSRYPFREATVIPIPDPVVKDEPAYYETRCVIKTIIDSPEGAICCLVCHMGLAKAEAKNAVAVLCDIIDSTDMPLILMGDFNNTPDSELLQPLFERLNDTAAVSDNAAHHTYPSYAPAMKIDYILYRGLTCQSAAVIEQVVSDHFPIVAELTI